MRVMHRQIKTPLVSIVALYVVEMCVYPSFRHSMFERKIFYSWVLRAWASGPVCE